MRTTELLLEELDLEAQFTRVHLERVPMDKFQFKPYEKSMTLGWLANFIGILPSWGTTVLAENEFDVAPQGGTQEDVKLADSTEALLALFDKNLGAMREALTRLTDDRLDELWALKAGGQTLFSQPRGLVYRTFIMNHLVHHRAHSGCTSAPSASRSRRYTTIRRMRRAGCLCKELAANSYQLSAKREPSGRFSW